MPAIFVHLSDIHFGQERDERVHVHGDVKKQLIIDAAEVIRALPGGTAHGILVSGDIAFSGLQAQYIDAGVWLDNLAQAIGCEIYRIQMVPGNHDVNRAKHSIGAGHLLDVIRQGGATEYEKILTNEVDRAALFARFEDFAQFCEGYDCPLDAEGRYSTNLLVELAPGRAIRFIRMNSSLLCTGDENDEEPELMVGARQFTIERTAGEETIVLIHHPLNWFKDNEDAARYLQSRARVMISGHEHKPKVHIEPVENGTDFMMLAAGATVPFKSDDEYTFTYNIIEFDWDSEQDALAVTVHPRAWNPLRTCFEVDEKCLDGKGPRFVLDSPNFRKDARVQQGTAPVEASTNESEPIVEVVAALNTEGDPAVPPEDAGYRLVLLRFFRDLSEGERLTILVELGAIETGSDERITQAVERQLLDWLVREGRISKVEKMIEELIAKRTEESGQ
ncbi:metallophosphoesterase [Verrucomicrobiota bacterium sgz303538]